MSAVLGPRDRLQHATALPACWRFVSLRRGRRLRILVTGPRAPMLPGVLSTFTACWAGAGRDGPGGVRRLPRRRAWPSR